LPVHLPSTWNAQDRNLIRGETVSVAITISSRSDKKEFCDVKTFAAFALAAVALPVAAHAQTAPAQAGTPATANVAAGATVYDTAGGVVGTVDSTDGTNAVINTGTVKAAVPVSSLGAGAKGPVLAMTKVQLDAAAGQQQAQATADFKTKLVPGAIVYGASGDQIGTIKTMDATTITVTTPQGDAKLPSNGFGPGAKGVTLGMTAAQLAQAMGAAAPAAGATAGAAAPAAGTATTESTTTTTTTEPAPAATEAAPAPTKKKRK
jgi:preprotein translocase subunit YajC